VPRGEGKPRLVVDSNVFVSSLISPTGVPSRILEYVRQGKAVHLVSDPIIEEYLRVLNYPRIRKFKKITDASIVEIAAYLIYETERVELVSSLGLSDDPDDEMFLSTAVDGRATLIVTGDKAHLLSIGEVDGIPIVSARNAAERLGIL
jgi:uncharacterized protein